MLISTLVLINQKQFVKPISVIFNVIESNVMTSSYTFTLFLEFENLLSLTHIRSVPLVELTFSYIFQSCVSYSQTNTVSQQGNRIVLVTSLPSSMHCRNYCVLESYQGFVQLKWLIRLCTMSIVPQQTL